MQCPKCGKVWEGDALFCEADGSRLVDSAEEKSKASTDEIQEISLENETKKCPMCAEIIKLEAKKCRFCGAEFKMEDIEEIIADRREKIRIIIEEKKKRINFLEGELAAKGSKQCPTCGRVWENEDIFCKEDGSRLVAIAEGKKKPRKDESISESKDGYYYEENRERKGPLTHDQMVDMINSRKLLGGTLIWKAGFDHWKMIEETEFKPYITVPLPLPIKKVSHGYAWCLAFAPVIGMILEFIVAGAIAGAKHSDNTYLMNQYMYQLQPKLWSLTLGLNFLFYYLDTSVLKKAGHKISMWYFFIIPVYLYKRSTILEQNLGCFFCWIVCFILILLPIW